MSLDGSYIDALTGDPEYAARHKQKREQSVTGARQGAHAALENVGQGLTGMMDIFKPLGIEI